GRLWRTPKEDSQTGRGGGGAEGGGGEGGGGGHAVGPDPPLTRPSSRPHERREEFAIRVNVGVRPGKEETWYGVPDAGRVPASCRRPAGHPTRARAQPAGRHPPRRTHTLRGVPRLRLYT